MRRGNKSTGIFIKLILVFNLFDSIFASTGNSTEESWSSHESRFSLDGNAGSQFAVIGSIIALFIGIVGIYYGLHRCQQKKYEKIPDKLSQLGKLPQDSDDSDLEIINFADDSDSDNVVYNGNRDFTC